MIKRLFKSLKPTHLFSIVLISFLIFQSEDREFHLFILLLFFTLIFLETLWSQNTSNIVFANRNVKTIVKSFSDFIFSNQLTLQLKQEKFKSIFDKSSDAYFILDSKFRINVYNDKVTTFFGQLKEVLFNEWISRNSPDSQPYGGESKKLFKAMVNSVQRQGEIRFEWEFKGKSGDQIPTEVSIITLPISETVFYFVVVRNVLNQKKIEDELRKNLEREKELNEMRSKFISMASHEFKTPLATILANLELVELKLEKQGVSLDQFGIQKYVQRMENESTRLNILMDEVLQLGKIEAGRTPYSPDLIHIEKFITDYLNEYIDKTHTTREIQLNFDIKCDSFWLDTDLIHHVFDNLMSNAIKYSNDEVIVNVKVDESSFLFEVIDKGLGIPLNEFSQLFESFFRASNTNHIPGTGLGLVIAKEFVEIHGGVIVCESEENKGSTFRVAIPSK
ncbi:PAS domain S-box protein [Flammeovirga sp. MY04]|uniref:PAS domain-containing sensor histidine kinase n=1 Tax=Flammeovirga sp. MY04 TaxID=1191459 RepID=UPI000806086A|nr:PAS domain-containing sensor histidine kinase [Flammeovirga sp. MY04]ANQ48948.1 PAS domain S-box protein [Flammeovirga sp. MY04]